MIKNTIVSHNKMFLDEVNVIADPLNTIEFAIYYVFCCVETIANKLHLQKVSEFALSPGSHPSKVSQHFQAFMCCLSDRNGY